MRVVEVSATFPADPGAVWDVLADAARWEEWLVIHRSWKTPAPTEPVEGDVATATARVMNMPISIDWTFDEVDRPASLQMSGITRARVALSLSISLTGEEGATNARIRMSVDGGMIDGPMGGVFKNALTSALERSLANAERLLP